MTGTITLTAAMRANLASLQGTAELMGNTQLRLSTGLKVNSALDNPSSFFAAQGLNQNASDMSALLDGMAQNVQTIKAASQGIAALQGLLQQAKAIAQTALSQPGASGTTTSTASFTAAGMADLNGGGGNLTLTVGTAVAQNFAIAANETMGQLLTAINGGVGLKAELVADPAVSGSYFLKVSATTGETLTVAGAEAGALNLNAGAYVSTADISAQNTQYTNLIAQMDKLTNDTAYRGKNLISAAAVGAMTTQFNAANTNQLLTNSVDLTIGATGLNLVTGANFTLGNMSTAVTGVIAKIDAAMTTTQNAASNFGNDLSIIQARSDFTTNLIATSKDGANQLTVADKNTEGANMLALQTAQQLGIQALSLASQANQSVLRLFQ